MRKFPTGLGLPPKRTSTTAHLWLGCQAAATDSLHDLVGGEHLTDYSDPVVSASSWPCASRSGDGSADYFKGATTGADATALTSDFSIICCFRAHPSITGDGVIFSYQGDPASETEDNNCLIQLKWIDATQKLQVMWEHSAGTDVSGTFDYVFELGEWYMIGLDCTVLSGSRYVDLFVDGSQYVSSGTDQVSGTNATDGTPAQVWRVLSDETDYFYGDVSVLAIHDDILGDGDHQEAFRRAQLWTVDTQVATRVRVKNYAGTFVDLTDHAGQDWVESVDWSDDVDQLVTGATVRLKRELYDLSLAKWHNNKMNVTPLPDNSDPGPTDVTYNDPNSGSSSELLELNREIKIDVARVPLGMTIASAHWQEMFHGKIDEIDWARDPIEVRARDMGCDLMIAYFEGDGTEDQGLNFGDGVKYLDEVIEDMLSAADTANWFAGTAPTLYIWPFGGDPDWVVNEFDQPRTPILAGLNDLAYQAGGWICRYRWNAAQSAFVLTLFQPPRDNQTPNAVFSGADYKAFSRLNISRANIRNAVRVVFPSTTAVSSTYEHGGGGTNEDTRAVSGWVEIAADGTVNAAWATPFDADSIGMYGRQFCEICDGGRSTSNIDSVDEGEALAIAILKDLMLPIAEASVSMFSFPEIELNDLLYLEANGTHTTADLTLAATRLRHSFSLRGSETTADLRCRPSGGYRRHLERESRSNGAPAPAMSAVDMIAGASQRARTAGRVGIGMATRASTTGEPQRFSNLVPNQFFVRRAFGGNNPPDSWYMSAGTWNTDASIYVGTTYAQSGDSALKLETSTAEVSSALIPVVPGHALEIDVAFKADGTTDDFEVDLTFYGPDKAVVTAKSNKISETVSTDWQVAKYIVPKFSATAAYVRVHLSKTGSTDNVYVDRCTLTEKRPAFHAYNNGTPSYAASSYVAFAPASERFDYWTNQASGVFTAPEDGKYVFEAGLKLDINSDGTQAVLALYDDIGGTPTLRVQGQPSVKLSGGNYANPVISSGIIYLSAGETIQVYVAHDSSSAATGVAGADISYFKGRAVSVE